MRGKGCLILVGLIMMQGLCGCRAPERYADASDRLLQVHRAHGGNVWDGWPTLAFDLEVAHGPNARVQRFYWHKPAGQVRFVEDISGTVMGMHEDTGWIYPEVREEDDPPSRSYLQYVAFMMGAPFLASGEYASSRRVWQGEGMNEHLRFIQVDQPTLTHDSIVKTATLGIDEDTHRLEEMSYVLSAPYLVPANTKERDWPRRLVRYSDFRNVQGMLLAHQWDLYDFERHKEEPTWVGTMRLVKIDRSAPPPDSRFMQPDGGKKDRSFEDPTLK